MIEGHHVTRGLAIPFFCAHSMYAMAPYRTGAVNRLLFGRGGVSGCAEVEPADAFHVDREWHELAIEGDTVLGTVSGSVRLLRFR
jgi:hypothetical protein